MDEVPINQHNQNNEEKMYGAMEQDLILEKTKLTSNEFKQKWLTMTLNFIKDDNQHVLAYPEMPFGEMDFIESLIIHKYNINLGAELRPLFASIEEAITIFQLKYDFTLKSVIKGDKTIQLFIRKFPKDNGSANDKSMESCKNAVLPPKRANKVIRKKAHIVSSVKSEYVLDSLRKISDFLKDDTSASIIFQNVTKEEWIFLKNVKSLSQSRHQMSDILCVPVIKLLEKIATYSKHDFTLVTNNTRKNERNVILKKVPNFGHQIRRSMSLDRNEGIPSRQRSEASSRDNSNPGNEFLKVINASATHGEIKRPTSWDRQNLTSSMENLTVSASNVASIRQVNIDRRSVSRPNTIIDFQSCGTIDYQRAENLNDRPAATMDRGRSLARRLGPMKTKLLKAMSVPLESDRGLRMMQLMGWKGGALGARGNGITEPLIPVLDIVTGAGFGHTEPLDYRPEPKTQNKVSGAGFGHTEPLDYRSEPKTQNKASISDKVPESVVSDVVKTRLKILDEILEFVLSKVNTKTIHFDKQLKRNEKNFLKPAIKCFNGKKKFSLSTVREQTMVQKVHDAMARNRDIILHAKVLSNKMAIVLSKTINRINLEASIADMSNEESSRNLNNAEIFASNESLNKISIPGVKMKDLTLTDFMSSMEPMETYGMNSKKKFRELSFKLMVLEGILEFLKSQDLCIIFHIIGNLFKKDLQNITKYINHANVRHREFYSTPTENSLNEKILDELGDCFLSLDYNRNHQTLKIRRVLPEKSSSVSVATNVQVRTGNTGTEEDFTGTDERDETLHAEVNTMKTTDGQKSRIINLDPELEEIIDQEFANMDVKDDDMVDWDEDLSDKSSVLLKDIENLEKSIIEEQTSYEEESRSIKRLHSDFEPDETETYKKAKPNDLKSYKNVGVMCRDRNEMNPETIKAIQKVLSDAIDECDDNLPLLQCHGANDNQLVYSCFNEHTYLWMKGILRDKFIIEDIAVNLNDKHRLQMKLRSFIDVDTRRILDTIKLYNPDLDISTWAVGRKVFSDDFIFMDVEVDGDALNYINQSDFSLFAGVDVAQFNIIN